MPALYLLDTSTLSNLIRQPQGRVAERIAQVGEANVLTSVIVACELRYGAAKRGSRKLTRQVEAILGALTSIDAVCVTDNVAEFNRVPALEVENWLR